MQRRVQPAGAGRGRALARARPRCPAGTCAELVHHVVEEERWAPPLLAGQTIEQVGDRFAGDLLGADPVAAGAAAAAEAEAAVAEPGALGAHRAPVLR